jgi:alpha-1,2-mannosyltransferase
MGQWYTDWSLGTLLHSDLYIFRGGGELVLHGSPLYGHHFWAGYWTYPPFGGLAMVPLALVPIDLLFPLWTALSLTALVAVVYLSTAELRASRPKGWHQLALTVGLTLVALPLTPVADALGMGQIGIMLTAACLIDVVAFERRGSRWTGVLIGVAAAVKLTPALFIAYFLVRRQWRAASVAMMTLAACWSLSALLRLGDTVDYVRSGVMFNVAGQIDTALASAANQSIYGAALRGLPDHAFVVYALAGAVVAVACLESARRLGNRSQFLAAASVMGLGSVLLSPIAWHHHAVWVVPALGVILGPGTPRRRVVVTLVLAVGLMIPMASSEAFTGTSDWFVILYICLLISIWWFKRSDLGSRQTSGRGSNREFDGNNLNQAPSAYFQQAYNPVMYSGIIGLYSTLVHRLMERGQHGHYTPTILELGAGAGQHVAHVRSRYDVYYETDVSAFDDPVGAQDDRVVRRQVDAQDLSEFDDDSVDRIVATCLLAHLREPEIALQEWRRVLRPGGSVSIYVPAEPGIFLRLTRRLFVVPKARRLGQDHLAIIYRDHRNHYPTMRTLIESVFRTDRVQRRGFPVGLVGWNLRLFDIFVATKSAVGQVPPQHVEEAAGRPESASLSG